MGVKQKITIKNPRAELHYYFVIKSRAVIEREVGRKWPAGWEFESPALKILQTL